MRELKCKRCGADLETWNVEAEGLYGRCKHCKTSYLIDDVERSHVIVDVRLPDGSVGAGESSLSRRGLIAGTVALAAVGIGVALVLPGLGTSSTDATTKRRTIRPIWNVGGKGAGPGQFRDYVAGITIDGQGRSAITTVGSPIVQLFDSDGRFLSRWLLASEGESLRVALPGGELIVDGDDGLGRRNPVTGQILEDNVPSRLLPVRGFRVAATPAGGFLVYYEKTEPPLTSADDCIAYFGPDGSFIRAIGPLVRNVLRPSPAVSEEPKLTDITVDGMGTIFFLLKNEDEYDTRGGIYAFTSDGVFLRKLEVEQKYYGELAAAADGSLFHADPWTTRLTRIKGPRVDTIDITELEVSAEDRVAIGMAAKIAVFPNGDLAVATSEHRYLRVRWPEDETS